jgi:hypothetical protein
MPPPYPSHQLERDLTEVSPPGALILQQNK